MDWYPITSPPDKSCYVMIAGYHHKMPVVLAGFCKIHRDGVAHFTEERYTGHGLAITHWMPLPDHPMRREHDENNT